MLRDLAGDGDFHRLFVLSQKLPSNNLSGQDLPSGLECATIFEDFSGVSTTPISSKNV